jgi:multicomponent Na+:H+ antiporter subunit D
MIELHPAAPLLLGALLLPLVGQRPRQVLLVLLPALGLLNLLNLEDGTVWTASFAGFDLTPLRVDRLSLLFGYIFHIAALLSGIYALHLRDRVQHLTAFLYAGGAVGAVFAGDLLTLFVFWEVLAVSSVFQIWANRTPKALRAGTRYLLWQITSGLLLMVGAGLQLHETGNLAFAPMALEGAAAWCLLGAFGIKCAFPLLHTWLVDGYPEATATGTVFLATFSTKTSVYALARVFAGAEELIWIGAAMTVLPIFYAVIENNLRRVLAYSLMNQLGFMVVGVGIGTETALNGTAAHAFAHILYKAVLFMSMGAVLLRTGRINGSELGGLYKSMPITAGFCIVGAASISAFPLFSGFVTKSMIMADAAHGGHLWVWLILLFASAGVVEHAGIKVPYFTFYAHDSGIRCREAPANMLVAMGLAAGLCVLIGCFPGPLYSILPYPVDYVPYTVAHVVQQLQLLLFAALAFLVLQLARLYPPELPSINIDADWIWRRMVPAVAVRLLSWGRKIRRLSIAALMALLQGLSVPLSHLFAPMGLFGRTWSAGSAILVVLLVLLAYLLLYFIRT